MATRSVQQSFPPMEVERLDRADRAPRTVTKLDRLPDVRLKAAKAGMGACVRDAIGPRPLKEFGSEALVSRVCNGDVPDYLARIYEDERARRRFGLALLTHDDSATVHVTLPPLKKEAK